MNNLRTTENATDTVEVEKYLTIKNPSLIFGLFIDSRNETCLLIKTLFSKVASKHPKYTFMIIDIAQDIENSTDNKSENPFNKLVCEYVNDHSIKQIPTVVSIQNSIVTILSIYADPLVVRKSIEKEIELQDVYRKLIDRDGFVIFIKGTKENPKCKYTRSILNVMKDIDFHDEDILGSHLRDGMKKYSGYYIYPMVYHNRTLIGGISETSLYLKTL
eukprot:GHVP01036331.1.p1 GENE.GHVP01036331.1~~GHVP01036331.1.p1  ORF type:complete len:217 (+),score=17.85 GHVP01036331.1:1746-2396(+)